MKAAGAEILDEYGNQMIAAVVSRERRRKQPVTIFSTHPALYVSKQLRSRLRTRCDHLWQRIGNKLLGHRVESGRGENEHRS